MERETDGGGESQDGRIREGRQEGAWKFIKVLRKDEV